MSSTEKERRTREKLRRTTRRHEMPGVTTIVEVRRRKYAMLLVLILVALAMETLNAQSGTARLRSDALRTLLDVAIWVVVFRRPRERAAMAAILVTSVAIGWSRYFIAASLDPALSVADDLMFSLLLWGAVRVILLELFRTPVAGTENVFGAICGYLIAGQAWAHINTMAYLLAPSAYSINPDLISLLHDWHGRLAVFTYYSFSQVLTIGYSDVTPVRAPATTLSLFAALFGVFYTAVVISQFVGLAQNAKREPPIDHPGKHP
jgi:voltage-gated potassium channel